MEDIKYDSLKNPSAFPEAIPMNATNNWDNRPYDTSNGAVPIHNRQNSTTSMSDVMSQPVQQPTGGYTDYGYQQQQYPGQAYTHDPGPTPKFSDAYYGGPSPDVQRPLHAQGHPGES